MRYPVMTEKQVADRRQVGLKTGSTFSASQMLTRNRQGAGRGAVLFRTVA